MKIEVEIKVAPELKELLEQLVEAIWDLAEVAAPMTGHKIKRREKE